jgi:hypothetical protein
MRTFLSILILLTCIIARAQTNAVHNALDFNISGGGNAILNGWYFPGNGTLFSPSGSNVYNLGADQFYAARIPGTVMSTVSAGQNTLVSQSQNANGSTNWAVSVTTTPNFTAGSVLGNWTAGSFSGDGSAVTNMVITGPTNATAPGNTTTPKAWANFTNSSGGVFKVALYQ